MTDTHMQKAVKRINEARERGEIGVDMLGLEIQEIPRELLELADTLKWLELSNTKVTDISPLANLTNLKLLILRETNVSDISPLADLTKLIALYLWETGVSDISPLRNLTKIETLDLSRSALVKSPANTEALEKLRENGCEIFGAEEFMK